MNTVEPIRDEKKIKAMKVILKDKNIRDYALFTLGINTGLRISDLLNLRVNDVVASSGDIKDNIYIREVKTGKEKVFSINKTAKCAIKEYLSSMNSFSQDWFLFKSQKGVNKAISRVHAYETLNDAAKIIGINEKIGTHTLRKTFGYHARMKGVPIEVLQRIFNHAAPGITMRYIGITQDELENVYLDLNL
jgi:site-specific recombinase XerD